MTQIFPAFCLKFSLGYLLTEHKRDFASMFLGPMANADKNQYTALHIFFSSSILTLWYAGY